MQCTYMRHSLSFLIADREVLKVTWTLSLHFFLFASENHVEQLLMIEFRCWVGVKRCCRGWSRSCWLLAFSQLLLQPITDRTKQKALFEVLETFCLWMEPSWILQLDCTHACHVHYHFSSLLSASTLLATCGEFQSMHLLAFSRGSIHGFVHILVMVENTYVGGLDSVDGDSHSLKSEISITSTER